MYFVDCTFVASLFVFPEVECYGPKFFVTQSDTLYIDAFFNFSQVLDLRLNPLRRCTNGADVSYSLCSSTKHQQSASFGVCVLAFFFPCLMQPSSPFLSPPFYTLCLCWVSFPSSRLSFPFFFLSDTAHFSFPRTTSTC